MKLIPNKCKRNDCVNTPIYLTDLLVSYFRPTGKILDPCSGSGNFLKSFKKYGFEDKDIFDCEIGNGRDFFNFYEKVDWIITNPPYSQMRKFLQHSMNCAINIVFLAPINHLWLKARLRDIYEQQFGIETIVIFDAPKEFPQS